MPPRPSAKAKPGKKRKKKQKPVLSRTSRPANLSLEEWQIRLRRQFGRAQKFRLENTGSDPVFSTFRVTNPASGNTYAVRIRGRGVGHNRCSCPDFATNTLGTCKHIEFALARLERGRENRARLKAGHLPQSSEVYLQYGSQREVLFRPGADCPPELARLAARYFDATSSLRADKVASFPTFLARAGKLEPALECGEDVLAFVAELRDAALRARRVAEAYPDGVRSAAFDGLLKVSLYDYQREGALFAARAGRCLIGDEMGLGKTIQALAAAEIMARLYGVERVLIICPTSLKHQWEREIARFTGRTVGVINGLHPARREAYAAPGHFFKVTNYDTVHRDLELIEGWAPDLVILDEAQRIKNWTTRVARSVKRVSSPHAIVLTGTPLENRLEELISLVQYVDPYRLGPTFRLLDNHQLRDEVGKVIGYRDLDRLGQTLAPVLLRRQKDQVLDQLPGRIDSNVFVPMPSQQRAWHDDNAAVVARLVARWRKYRHLSEADQRRLMSALQCMRMACDTTYLEDPATDFGTKADEAATLLGELLERPETKVVIFSQWLGMHEVLLRRVAGRGWGHVFFHGGVPAAKRRDLVDRFRDDPACRLFLSTDAGGVGLNLQHASVVFNLDLPWNPAVLEQRVGRVHRLGQKQPVRVVNFIARGTIEEGMLGLIKFKKSLFAGILDGGEKEVFLGGTRLSKFMESVASATGSIPADAAQAEASDPEPEPEPSAGPVPPADPELPGLPGGETEPEQPPAPGGAGRTLPAPAPAADPWASLLQVGVALLQQIAPPPKAGETGPRLPGRVCRDESTGESYLRLPVPPPQVLEQALGALAQLVQSMRGQ